MRFAERATWFFVRFDVSGLLPPDKGTLAARAARTENGRAAALRSRHQPPARRPWWLVLSFLIAHIARFPPFLPFAQRFPGLLA